MRVDLVLLFCSSLASAVLARLAHRQTQRQRHSESFNRAERSVDGASGGTQYNPNWAGAVWQTGNGFDYVSASFTVPTLNGAPGSASAWVGIDGSTCQSAILQTGVDLILHEGNVPEYLAWYQWWPDNQYFYPDFPISAGDNITVIVYTKSTTSGLAIIENVTQGKIARQYLTSSHPLCMQNVEWIVEDYVQDGQNVPFAHFGTLTFRNTKALIGSKEYSAQGATILDIGQPGSALTSTQIHGKSVIVKHT